MPDAAVIAAVSKTLPTLMLEERGGTPAETLRKRTTIPLDDIRPRQDPPPLPARRSVIDRQGDRDE
jgi:hypothetical protein